MALCTLGSDPTSAQSHTDPAHGCTERTKCLVDASSAAAVAWIVAARADLASECARALEAGQKRSSVVHGITGGRGQLWNLTRRTWLARR